MKKALIILFVFQYTGIVLGFSQGEAVKPATDACPTWNKKQSTNKLAFYNAANKKSNSKEVKEFSSPKYQYLFPNKSQNQSSTAFASRGNRPAGVDVERSEKTTAATAPKKKNEEPVVEEKKAATIQEQKTETPVSNPKEENVVPSGKGKDATVNDSKEEPTKRVKKTKRERKHWLKKLKFGRKKAADCPDF
jgi:hypothetical protein